IGERSEPDCRPSVLLGTLPICPRLRGRPPSNFAAARPPADILTPRLLAKIMGWVRFPSLALQRHVRERLLVDRVRALLAGPRGRHFTAAVACRCSDAVRPALYEAGRNPDGDGGVATLARALSDVDLRRIPDLSVAEVYEALADSVSWAR